MSMAGRITQAWQRKAWYLYLLWPLSLLYRMVIVMRRVAYQRGVFAVQPSAIPVIVVGNITVGGTGKSPLVAALIQALQNAGYSPGIVSRGYGARITHDQPFRVHRDNDPAEVGDEPGMLVRMVSCPIVVCRHRSRAIETLHDAGCDVVVADDGMQHYRMARDIEVCVIDGDRVWGNGHLLPMGPLREPLSRLAEVSCLVVNQATSQRDVSIRDVSVPQFAMTLKAQPLRPLVQEAAQRFEVPQPPCRVHALAGIGNPQRFFQTLEALGYEVVPHAFADHHQFSAADMQFDEVLPLIMTAKDAVKCERYAPPDSWVLPVEASTETAFFECVFSHLERAVKTRLRGRTLDKTHG